MPPTCDDFVLCSARGKFGVVHVSVANHCPRLDSLYAGCIPHGSYPWQIDLYVAGRGDDLWAVGASRAPYPRQATRQQIHPSFELGHSQNQIRPLRVETGQYRSFAEPTPPRFNGAMPALIRRRSKDAHAESWQIFYGDVQVGTIGKRSGVPVDVDQ